MADAAPPAPPPILPWYSFPYRLFGAAGSFWLWILACAGLWLVIDDATISLRNTHPAAPSVAHAASGQELEQRWVQLVGVELSDARKLLGKTGASGSPVRLLLDPSDPAAKRWLTLADLAQRLGSTPDSSSPAGRDFEELKARFPRERQAYVPTRPILLYDDGGVAAVTSETHVAAPIPRDQVPLGTDPLELVELEFGEAVRLAREQVAANVTYSGVLVELPQTRRRRLYKELGVNVASRTLRVGRQPERLPVLVFGLCALTLVFLGAGLQGVLAHDRQLRRSRARAPGGSAPPGT